MQMEWNSSLRMVLFISLHSRSQILSIKYGIARSGRRPQKDRLRQITRSSNAYADMVVYIRLKDNPQQALPICVHDPICVVLAPQLLGELQI